MIDKNSLDDVTLAKLSKDGDSESTTILAKRHGGIFYMVANKYMTSGTIAEDIRNNLDYTVWRAASSYEEDKGKFSSWLGLTTKYECCGILNQNHLNDEVSVSPELLEEVIDNSFTSEIIGDGFKTQETKENISMLEDILSQVQNVEVKNAVEERFCKGRVKTYKETGKIIGVSGQAIKNREDLFVKLARSKFASKQCIDTI